MMNISAWTETEMITGQVAALERELAAVNKRYAILLEAAQPFARLVDWYDQSVKNEFVIYDYDSASMLFTVGDLRRLAEAASSKPRQREE
jgi:hypothetical protein